MEMEGANIGMIILGDTINGALMFIVSQPYSLCFTRVRYLRGLNKMNLLHMRMQLVYNLCWVELVSSSHLVLGLGRCLPVQIQFGL